MRTSLRLALAAAVLAAAPVLAQTPQASQTPPQPPPAGDPLPAFDEIIDVRVVNLEVVVTDRKGNRVTDLKPGDFRLKIDNKEVPISFFSEVRDGQVLAAAAQAGKEDVPAPVQSVAPGETVGTHYLVFIDEYFSVALQRNQVLTALKADLSRLGPQDRMSLVAYDGARLARLAGWTGSPAELAKAFDAAMARPSRGLDRLAERRSFLNAEAFEYQINGPMIGGKTMSTGPVTEDSAFVTLRERVASPGLGMQEKAYGSTLVRQVDSAISAVVSAMRGSAAPQGRKVLLLLAGGWPFSVESFLRGAEAPPTAGELPDGEELFGPLTSTANLLGYTIYPVDVPGIETPVANAESDRTFSGLDSVREQEAHGSVQFIAQQTGGQAILNTRRDEAFPTAIADTRSYYWLGFSPAWERNDRSHKIQVEVLRPGLRTRTRRDFLDLSFKTEMGMLLESALLFGSLPNTIPMPMRVGTPVRSSKGEVEIPITLGFPVDALTVISTNGRYVGKVELRIAAADENGNRSEVIALPLDLASDRPPKAGGFVKYETKVKLRGKASHIAAVSYDMLSGKMAAAQAEVAQ